MRGEAIERGTELRLRAELICAEADSPRRFSRRAGGRL